jgi:hypothetical protein
VPEREAREQDEEPRQIRVGTLVARDGDREALLNRYVKLASGAAGKLGFKSSNERIALVSERGQVAVLSEGDVTIQVSGPGGHVEIPLKVVRVPQLVQTQGGEVAKVRLLEGLGYPDHIVSGILRGKEQRWVHGIRYSVPRERQSQIYEHWLYDRYPGVVFQFVDGLRFRLTQPGWQSMRDLARLLRWESAADVDAFVERMNEEH